MIVTAIILVSSQKTRLPRCINSICHFRQCLSPEQSNIEKIEEDINQLKIGVTALTARQTELEVHDIALAEKLLKDCNNKK